MAKENIVIVAAARTPIGKFLGSLKDLEASDLGGIVIKEAVKRAGIQPADVDEVVFGCVGQAAENAFAARLSAVKGGIPYEAGALTVNRLCSSGLQAIVTAAQEIRDGMAAIAVAGGCESMSNLPFYLRSARTGYRMGHGQLEDGLITALSDPFSGNHMGWTAENVAERFEISREEQDRWAAISQERAAKAQEEGKFTEEIVPIEVKVNRKETKIFDYDEHVRPGTTVEKLAKLRPAFRENGTVTAGNAAGINDAAAAVVLMKESKAEELGIKPIARLLDAAFAETGITKEQIDLIELNEAFASQTLACMKELGLDEEKVNVNGSGISLGHPIGATGCIITIKLIQEMKRRDARYGVATLCIGGGQGLAVLFENCR